jgi:AcrR family transcriptional regulator
MVVKQIKAKTKDREATEERLILAAKQIFSKYGLNGATTRMIAKKADINVALITRYFDGKYGLFIKVLEHKHREVDEVVLPYTQKETITEECLAYAYYKLQFCMQDLNFFKIVMAQFLTDPKFLKKFQETLLTFDNFTTFENRMKYHIQKGTLSKDVKLQSVFDDIETQVFGIVIGEVLIRGEKEEEIKNRLKIFITQYCKSLEK